MVDVRFARWSSIKIVLLLFVLPGIVYGLLLGYLVRNDLAKNYGIYHYPSRASSISEYEIGSLDYLQYSALAENILHNGVFSFSEKPPYLFQTFRTPGYPLFIAFFLWLFKSYVAVVIAQIGLVLLSGFLIWKFANRLFASQTIGYVVAYVFLFNPAVLPNTISLYTESLFVFLFISAVYLLTREYDKDHIGVKGRLPLIAAGLLMGIATHVRPIGIYLPFVFLVWLVVLRIAGRIATRKAAKIFLTVVFGFSIPVAPWIIRNYAHTGVAEFASNGIYTFLFSDVRAMLITEMRGKRSTADQLSDSDRITRMLAEEAAVGSNAVGSADYRSYKFQDMENLPRMREVAFTYVRGHPFAYAKMHTLGMVRFLLSGSFEQFVRVFPGMEERFVTLRLLPKEFPTLYWDLSQSRFAKVISDLRSQLLLVAERLFWVGIVVLSAGALIFRRKSGAWPALVFFALFVLYVAALAGPVSSSRFRIPTMPFMLLSAAGGWLSFRAYFAERQSAKPVTEAGEKGDEAKES